MITILNEVNCFHVLGEIEYFYPDGSVIPKESNHGVIAKTVPSVLPPNNCFSQAPLMSIEFGIKPSSCRGKWV